MGELRQLVIEQIAHQPALPAVHTGNVPDMVIEIVRGQVLVQDLLAEEIGMQVCCLLDDIERGENGFRRIDPAYPHARRDDLGK